eukprot:183124-Karenia_brevis.AAC.1
MCIRDSNTCMFATVLHAPRMCGVESTQGGKVGYGRGGHPKEGQRQHPPEKGEVSPRRWGTQH